MNAHETRESLGAKKSGMADPAPAVPPTVGKRGIKVGKYRDLRYPRSRRCYPQHKTRPADRRRSRPHELSCHKRAESLWILCGRSRGSNGFCLKILNAAAARCRSCGDNLLKARRNDLAARKRYFTPADRDLVEPHPTRLRRHVQFRPSPA